MLFTTNGLEEHISGVILFDETLHQSDDDGRRLVDILIAKGIIPGIKVDKGLMPLTNFPDEKITKGLDTLADNLARYAELGARFTKWRAVIKIGEDGPSPFAIKANCHALARFAALSQSAGLVPIVEPEVLIDGNHSLAQCEVASVETLACLFEELRQHRVHLEGLLLKASMITSGKDSANQCNTEEVAKATVRVLQRTLPAAVPGVVFLSGGQTPIEATAHLNAINGFKNMPWELSFSFGRALQEPVLKTWLGSEENIAEAQQALYQRAKLNGAARYADYQSNSET